MFDSKLAARWLLLVISAAACLPKDEDGQSRTRRGTLRSSAGPKLGKVAAVAEQAPSSARKPPAPRAKTQAPLARTEADGGAPSEAAGVFEDGFEREAIGRNYRTSASSAWRIDEGSVCAHSPRNQPLWLARRLPKNARIEFDAVSHSADGDIKVEAWGDGRSAATTTSYTNATSYLFIYGGWRNTLHVLARRNEHGKDRRELRVDPDGEDPRTLPVFAGQSYHFVIERRDGRTVSMSVDETEILSFVDSAPLDGPGHDHFAFNAWEAQVCFDNLNILPLDG